MLKKKALLICIFLAVVTFLAYWRVNNCNFINYDDKLYVTENGHVLNGLTMDGFRWAFTTGHATNWHPLTWLSHMADVQLFGLNPRWHHRTNILLHIANTLLLFFVLRRLTKTLWQSAFVAALFALHPLHVESVAWVAERKDVLSTFFWMLTMAAYCYYLERRGPWRYISILICFALGLMAKPMLVSLPLVLLLLDYWPLGRLEEKTSKETILPKLDSPMASGKQKGKKAKKNAVTKEKTEVNKPVPASVSTFYRWSTIMPLLWEKALLFVLAVLSSIATFAVQQAGGAAESLQNIPLSVRIANAFLSYVTYILKMFWPLNLAVIYPYHNLVIWQVWLAVLVFVGITLIIVWTAKRYKYLAVGWFWYVITLIPVIGIVQVGRQALADRYTYVPLIGIFIILAWGIPELLDRWHYRKTALIVLSLTSLLFCFIVTWTQVGYWRDSITLFSHALAVTDYNHIAYDVRGSAYAELGKYKEAIEDYDRSIEIFPAAPMTYNERGHAYKAVGNYTQALKDFDRTIELKPNIGASTYNDRGDTYIALGNYKSAIIDFEKAIELDSEYAAAHNNRGLVYVALGMPTQAISDYDRAIKIDPKFAMAYNCRGNAYVALGNYQQAIMDYNRAIELNPKLASAYNDQGLAYAGLGDYRQALMVFDKAIQLDPNVASAYHNRAAAHDRLGNRKQVFEDMKAAAKLGDKGAQDFLKNQGMN